MFNSKSLRIALKNLFGVEDKYIVPISEGWFVPTLPEEETVGTWIGYRIMSYTPYTRSLQMNADKAVPVKVSFRMTFVGPEAEELAQQTLLWETRSDVTKIFEDMEAQINYTNRHVFSYPLKNKGFNDMCCWVVDLSAQTFYKVNANYKPWFEKA